jgi:transcription elongation factor SPT6
MKGFLFFYFRRMKTEDEAIRASKFMLATQISREPLVRSSVREVFFERATINVNPTKKGQKEIDEAHPCYRLKLFNFECEC